MPTASRTPADPVLRALLLGDSGQARRLIAAELDRPGTGTAGRARLLAHRAFCAILESDFAGAYADCVLAPGPAAGDYLLVVVVRALASATGGLRSDPAGATDLAARIAALGEEELGSHLWAACLTAEVAMSVGRLDLAEVTARRVWSFSLRGDTPETVFGGMTLTRALLFQGRLHESEELGREVDDRARRHDLLALQLVVSGTLAYVAALSGDADGLLARVAQIETLAGRCAPSYLANGAMVLAAYGLAAMTFAQQAADMFLRAAGPDLAGVQLVDRVYGYELLVTAALSVGDLDAASTWGARCAELPGVPADGMAAAAVRRVAARLAVAHRDPAHSAELAEQASTIAGRNAGHLDAVRAQLLAATALLHGPGDEDRARAVLSDVGNRTTALGATTLALLARRDLRSIGLRLSGSELSPMSTREREVADLLMTGCSNAAIATVLGISERTVQSHVRRVLEALEIPSRVLVPNALGRSSTAAATGALTTRQREVADLVSRGYTNVGVARALDVSVKTVEKHLGDVYRRLGVTSRAALAARWSPEQPTAAVG